jgi:tetratricopeptide (TPR) repeat protein
MALKFGSLTEAANYAGNEAEARAELEQIEEAEACLKVDQEILQSLEEPRVELQYHLARGLTELRARRFESSEAALEKGLARASGPDMVDLKNQILFVQARLRWAQGRAEEARKILEGLRGDRYPSHLPLGHKRIWDEILAGAPAAPP